jgi:hypothetical protein
VAQLAPDRNIQQATVNLFADMGIQPVTLQSDLVPATQTEDVSPPMSRVISCSHVESEGVNGSMRFHCVGEAADLGDGR